METRLGAYAFACEPLGTCSSKRYAAAPQAYTLTFCRNQSRSCGVVVGTVTNLVRVFSQAFFPSDQSKHKR